VLELEQLEGLPTEEVLTPVPVTVEPLQELPTEEVSMLVTVEHLEELRTEEVLTPVSVDSEVALLTLALVGMAVCTGES